MKRQACRVEKGLDRLMFEITDDVMDWAATTVASAKVTTEATTA
jgi:hypothetical protein